jgi:hypothetical protein
MEEGQKEDYQGRKREKGGGMEKGEGGRGGRAVGQGFTFSSYFLPTRRFL